MNFQAVKIMVESLVEIYKCPNCQSNINEENIDIMGTAGSNINVEIICPKCKSHDIIKGQMMAMNIPIQWAVKNNWNDNIEELKAKLAKFEKYKWRIEELKISKNSLIKDSNIIELNKNLKSKNLSISELFKEN